MARMQAVTHIEASPQRVWEVLVAWERQPEWMHDARSVRVTSPHRRGTDVTIVCATDIAAGIVIDDPMLVTEWDEEHVLGVLHQGSIIRGVGAFELEQSEYGTVLTWWEEATVPFGAVGELVASATVVPWVNRVFRTSLAGLKRSAEADESGDAAA